MGSGQVRYINGCCGIGAVASITCDDGFQPIGDTLTLHGTRGLQCGYNSFEDTFVWAPSGDVYCGRGNDKSSLFVLSFLQEIYTNAMDKPFVEELRMCKLFNFFSLYKFNV